MAAIDYLLPRREHPALPALRHAEVVPLTDKRVVGLVLERPLAEPFANLMAATDPVTALVGRR